MVSFHLQSMNYQHHTTLMNITDCCQSQYAITKRATQRQGSGGTLLVSAARQHSGTSGISRLKIEELIHEQQGKETKLG